MAPALLTPSESYLTTLFFEVWLCKQVYDVFCMYSQFSIHLKFDIISAVEYIL